MRFKDRKDAGEKLASLLVHYSNEPSVIVLGLARGGIVTAAPIAARLGVPLDVICPRKIGAPLNPELAIGAVTEFGDLYLNSELITSLPVEQAYIEQQILKEKSRAVYRATMFRQGLPSLDLRHKTVILVDDGIATGATIVAAIQSVQKQGAAKVIVAVPVAPSVVTQKIEEIADEMVVLKTPDVFFGVGQFYDEFHQIEDREVLQLLSKQT